MKSLRKLFEITPVLLAAVFALSVTSCSSKENEPEQPTEEELLLTGNITSDCTLKGGYTYKLDGEYIVESGATLNIEPGVKIVSIYDDKVDYILVKQGGKINAVGTAENPIIMTCEKEEPGSWGGIHICGFAHTNAEGGKGSSEIGGAPYGGNNDSDNSGVIKYVRLEYTGYAFDEEHEANGFTFYGVGNGTVVENCEA